MDADAAGPERDGLCEGEARAARRERCEAARARDRVGERDALVSPVRDAEGADPALSALLVQRLEDGSGIRLGVVPVQKVKVDGVGPEPFERRGEIGAQIFGGDPLDTAAEDGVAALAADDDRAADPAPLDPSAADARAPPARVRRP